MAKLKPFIFPTVLFLLSFILRLSLISKGPFHVDCLNLAIQSQKTLETHQLQYLFGSGYPLVVLLGALFQFFGKFFFIDDPVTAVNWMSVVFSSLCVPALYYLARKLFDDVTATFSSILLSITPIFLGVSVYGMNHAPSLFFLLMGTIYLITYLDSFKKRHLILSAIFLGLLGASRGQDLMLSIIPISFLFFCGTEPAKASAGVPPMTTSKIKLYVLASLLTVSTTFMFHIPFLFKKALSGYLGQFSHFINLVHESFRGFISPSLWESFKLLDMSLSSVGLMATAGGLLILAKRNQRVFGFFLLWILVPLFTYGNSYCTVSRFFVILLPPLLIAQGYFFSRILLINTLFRHTIMLTFALIVFLSLNSIFPILTFRHQNALLADFGQWVGRVTEANALIITVDHGLFIEYYGHRKFWHRPANPFMLDRQRLQDFKKELDHILKCGTPVYITDPGLYAYNPEHRFSILMEENYDIQYLGERLIEDWYQGCIRQRLDFYGLYKILPKTDKGNRVRVQLPPPALNFL